MNTASNCLFGLCPMITGSICPCAEPKARINTPTVGRLLDFSGLAVLAFHKKNLIRQMLRPFFNTQGFVFESAHP